MRRGPGPIACLNGEFQLEVIPAMRPLNLGGRRSRKDDGPRRLVQPYDINGDGAWGRIRTTDTRIFSPLLYQLSYPGPAEATAERPISREAVY